jgi:hypothetical protein
MSQKSQESKLLHARETLASALLIYERAVSRPEDGGQLEQAEKSLAEARVAVLKLSGALKGVDWSWQCMLDGFSILFPLAPKIPLVDEVAPTLLISDPTVLYRLHQSIGELFECNCHDIFHGAVVALVGHGTSRAVNLRLSDLFIIIPDSEVVRFVVDWQLTVQLGDEAPNTIRIIQEKLSSLEKIKSHVREIQLKLGQVSDVHGAGS